MTTALAERPTEQAEPQVRPGRPSKQEEKREQILEGLFAAMARAGTVGTSITDIAAAAGIARGALHYYFRSKEEIRLRLMERLGDRYIDGLSRYLDRVVDRCRAEGEPAGRALSEALVRYHFAPDDKYLQRILSVWIDFWGHAPTDPQLGQVVFDVQERARQQCFRVLCATQPAVCDVDEERARLMAASLLALIEGAILQWRIAHHAGAFDRRLLQQQIADAVWQLCQSAQLPLAPAGASASATASQSEGDA